MARKVKKHNAQHIGPERIELETFRRFSPWEVAGMISAVPSCFNGIVSVTKYRVVVEPIENSDQAVGARILKLWRESSNGHDRLPLRKAASDIGI